MCAWDFGSSQTTKKRESLEFIAWRDTRIPCRIARIDRQASLPFEMVIITIIAEYHLARCGWEVGLCSFGAPNRKAPTATIRRGASRSEDACGCFYVYRRSSMIDTTYKLGEYGIQMCEHRLSGWHRSKVLCSRLVQCASLIFTGLRFATRRLPWVDNSNIRTLNSASRGNTANPQIRWARISYWSIDWLIFGVKLRPGSKVRRSR